MPRNTRNQTPTGPLNRCTSATSAVAEELSPKHPRHRSKQTETKPTLDPSTVAIAPPLPSRKECHLNTSAQGVRTLCTLRPVLRQCSVQDPLRSGSLRHTNLSATARNKASQVKFNSSRLESFLPSRRSGPLGVRLFTTLYRVHGCECS
jgi:hypothetical protein